MEWLSLKHEIEMFSLRTDFVSSHRENASLRQDMHRLNTANGQLRAELIDMKEASVANQRPVFGVALILAHAQRLDALDGQVRELSLQAAAAAAAAHMDDQPKSVSAQVAANCAATP